MNIQKNEKIRFVASICLIFVAVLIFCLSTMKNDFLYVPHFHSKFKKVCFNIELPKELKNRVTLLVNDVDLSKSSDIYWEEFRFEYPTDNCNSLGTSYFFPVESLKIKIDGNRGEAEKILKQISSSIVFVGDEFFSFDNSQISDFKRISDDKSTTLTLPDLAKNQYKGDVNAFVVNFFSLIFGWQNYIIGWVLMFLGIFVLPRSRIKISGFCILGSIFLFGTIFRLNMCGQYPFWFDELVLTYGCGGDQVVIKTKDNLLYYGGKSIQQEKNTRVKARVKAQALRDSIINADKVVIMGHRLPDVDAIGSAIGIYRIAQSLEKPAKIIVNQVTSSLAPLLKLFENNKDYPDGTFVTSENAKEFIGNGNGVLLVVVDVNRPSYTDAPDLIPIVSSLVVIDHHRQTGESFENPTLSYVEPFASSASEMVAEILQYAGEEIRVKAVEADALYSGIMVDTNNFMNKPGVRTFEAVAFLRRSGADIIRIRKMFRSDIEEYKIRAEAIQNTEIFMDCFAISPCNADNCESPTIVGAKIADDLLDIKGIRATFVLTAYEGKVYISARSIDELNVQVVMEKMGGGGHITSAGAQLENCTLEEGAEQIKQILTKMKEEGDI